MSPNVIGDVKLNKRITSSEKARVEPRATVGGGRDRLTRPIVRCFEKRAPLNWETKQR